MSRTPSTGRSAGNDKDRVVQFLLGDAERIAKVVGIVEGARRQPNGSTLPRAVGGGGVQIATFTGAWSVGTVKLVTDKENTAVTSLVTNHFLPNIAFASYPRDCLVMGDILISMRC